MMWSHEKIERLKELSGQSELSATQIASAMSRYFNEHISRNMVIGKLHRIGIRGRHPIVEKKPAPVQRPRLVPRRPVYEMPPPVAEAEAPPPMIDNIASSGVEYLVAPAWGCKAILGKRGSDGLSMCCGQPRGLNEKGGESAYCPAHHRLYNVPRALTERRWQSQ